MLRPGVRRLFTLGLSGRDRIERDVDDELHTHIEHRIAQLMQRGLSRDDATRQAHSRFGEFERARHELKHTAVQRERRMNWRTFFDAVKQDVGYSLRGSRRKPGFALAVAVTLALGIGANAAMVGIVDRLLLRAPEHIRDADRIVVLGARWTHENRIITQQTFSYVAYRAFQNGLSNASHVGMTTFPTEIPVGTGAEARTIKAAQTNSDFFAMLGVRPLTGRFFVQTDDREPSGEAVVVISYGYWMREYSGDQRAVGQTIDIAGERYTIVGVAPRGFTGMSLSPIDMWLPIAGAGALRSHGSNWLTDKQSTWIRVYARLKPGISAEQLAAQATPINWSEGEPRHLQTGAKAVAVPMLQDLRESRGPVARVATLLAALSLIVVLIASTNVANLMLSRAVSRRQEVAVRLALGVTRFRLSIQWLSETFVFASLGAAGACGIAWLGGIAARVLIFGDREWAGSPIDSRIVFYIVALTAVAALFAGLIPAVQSRKASLTATLKSSAREGRRSGETIRSAILVGQAALSVLLLITAGLFVRSLDAVRHLPLGMQPDRVILGRMNTFYAKIPPERKDELFRVMVERLRKSPLIESATLSTTVAGHNTQTSLLFVPGIDSLPRPDGGGPYLTGVQLEFFETVGTRIVAGRNFNESDSQNSLPVAIVNQTMARMLWPNETALGRCIKLDASNKPCLTVVGVSENSRRQNWIEEEIFQIAQPITQAQSRARILLVRPRGEVDAQSISVVRNVMQGAAPALPFAEVIPLTSLYDGELRPWRLGAGLLGAFAALALFLVSVGLFATLSFAVSQRTQEIGVRMALGARKRQVVQLVMRQGMLLATIGGVIGVTIALAGGRVVESLLFGVSTRDAGVFAAAVAVLGTVAAVATCIPALRATRINPVRALRSE